MITLFTTSRGPLCGNWTGIPKMMMGKMYLLSNMAMFGIYVEIWACILSKWNIMLDIAFSKGSGTSPNATTKFHLPLASKKSTKSPLMRWWWLYFQQIHSGFWCSHGFCSCFKHEPLDLTWHIGSYDDLWWRYPAERFFWQIYLVTSE